MIPGVEPILLDLENPFLPSRDLKNRRKTQKLEVKIKKKLGYFLGICLYIELAMENPNLPSKTSNFGV